MAGESIHGVPLESCPSCHKILSSGSDFSFSTAHRLLTGIGTAAKRHVSYCRRAKPRTRPRSCLSCSAAKVKCSPTVDKTCMRCEKRGTPCRYEPSLPDLFSHQQSGEGAASLTVAISKSPQLDGNFFDFTSFNSAGLPGDGFFELLPNTYSGSGDSLDMEGAPLPNCSARQSMDGQTGALTRIHRSGLIQRHAANLIVESLCAVPFQMLRKSTFPSFIHPHWHQQRLPEPLAVCMEISKIFATRNAELRAFLWRSINSELEVFKSKVWCTVSWVLHA